MNTNIYEQYEIVTFNLNKAYTKLKEYNLEHFILNPEVKALTTEIAELEQQRKALEVLIDGAEQ